MFEALKLSIFQHLLKMKVVNDKQSIDHIHVHLCLTSCITYRFIKKYMCHTNKIYFETEIRSVKILKLRLNFTFTFIVLSRVFLCFVYLIFEFIVFKRIKSTFHQIVACVT